MLEAARNTVDFVHGVTFQQYEQDTKLKFAVERALEIIGEAGSKVSKDFQKSHPEIAWKGIIGLRNVLIHEYGEIRHERIWAVATQRIPELMVLLNAVIPPYPPSPPTNEKSGT